MIAAIAPRILADIARIRRGANYHQGLLFDLHPVIGFRGVSAMKFALCLAAGFCLAIASAAAAQNVPNPMPNPGQLQPGNAGQALPPQFGQPANNGQGAAAAAQQAFAQRFDLDGDGRLSAQEQLMATRAMQQRGIRTPGMPNLVRPGSGNNGPISGPGVAVPQQQAPAKKPGRREEILLKRFDKDGDGKLNDEEKAAARAELGQKNKADKK
jgi:hypothetical protein